MNRLKYGEEARASLYEGAKKMYSAVSSTLGASGRNVVRQNFGRPKITNDGVTIARAINLEDPFERQGADLLKEAAEQTVLEAGDGTTTAITLAFSFFEKGLELISKGISPIRIKNYIHEEVAKVTEKLKEYALEISGVEDLVNIATISVENPEYGRIIAESVHSVGKDGLVLVDEDTIPGVHPEIVSGYRFDRGLENQYLVTNPDKMEAVLEEKDGRPVPVLVADKQWNLVEDLYPLFEEIKKEGSDKLLIIAEEISGELMQFITVNRLKLRFHAVVVKTPFNKDMLEDIAALTGATALTSEKGVVTPTLAHLGKAKKIIVTQTTTTIIGGAGSIDDKVVALRQRVEDADEGYEKDKLKERLAKLTGKTVILKVGASTEAEAKYLKDKLDDAVAATRAAVEEGVVPGGGMTLFRIASDLYLKEENKDDELAKMMFEVLSAPVDKIMQNAGVEDTNKIAKSMLGNKESGFDALKGEVVENIVKSGIIDPLKVTRCALKNAESLAGMLITTDTVIAEIEKNEAGNR